MRVLRHGDLAQVHPLLATVDLLRRGGRLGEHGTKLERGEGRRPGRRRGGSLPTTGLSERDAEPLVHRTETPRLAGCDLGRSRVRSDGEGVHEAEHGSARGVNQQRHGLTKECDQLRFHLDVSTLASVVACRRTRHRSSDRSARHRHRLSSISRMAAFIKTKLVALKVALGVKDWPLVEKLASSVVRPRRTALTAAGTCWATRAPTTTRTSAG